jgi:hypothetical protein
MTIQEIIPWIAAVLLAVCSAGLLTSRSWRWSLGLLAAEYLAGFLLILAHWPLTMAASRLVAGWMAAVVLGMTHLHLPDRAASESSWPEGRLFRVFAAALVLMAVSAAANSLGAWLPDAALPIRWGGLVLIGLGLLHLGMTLDPLRVILGLLTSLLGFEVLYSTVENSILVAGLLGFVTLGLALAGSYLLILNSAEQPL